MTAYRSLALALLILALPGCYAAKIDTGRTPSTTLIKKSFAASWIYGLVPPSTVETAARCPNGVAIVQTKLSFVNQLVGALTLGIFTPMEIVVTCAEGPATGMREGEDSILLSESAAPDEVQKAFSRAADRAVLTGHAILIRTIPAEGSSETQESPISP